MNPREKLLKLFPWKRSHCWSKARYEYFTVRRYGFGKRVEEAENCDYHREIFSALGPLQIPITAKRPACKAACRSFFLLAYSEWRRNHRHTARYFICTRFCYAFPAAGFGVLDWGAGASEAGPSLGVSPLYRSLRRIGVAMEEIMIRRMTDVK